MFAFPSLGSILIGIIYQFVAYGGFNHLHTGNDWVFAILHVLFWWAFIIFHHLFLLVALVILIPLITFVLIMRS